MNLKNNMRIQFVQDNVYQEAKVVSVNEDLVNIVFYAEGEKIFKTVLKDQCFRLPKRLIIKDFSFLNEILRFGILFFLSEIYIVFNRVVTVSSFFLLNYISCISNKLFCSLRARSGN